LKKYIWSFDLSLSNTGFCIWDLDGNPLHVFSVKTTDKQSHPNRLRTIGNFILGKKEAFPTELIVIESGFTKFNKSTQALFKVLGVIQYLFYDCKQIFYASTTIKKAVCGYGKATKDQVAYIILQEYPNLQINNDDESDAVAIGVCHFLENRYAQKCL